MLNKAELELVIERARAYPAGHGYDWGTDGADCQAPSEYVGRLADGQASWCNA
jgi:hypothetical protein